MSSAGHAAATSLEQTIVEIVSARLSAQARALREAWLSATPLPYFVVDDLLPEELCREVAAGFPRVSEMARRESIRERKYTSAKADQWCPATRACFVALQQEPVLREVETITGIRDLVGDPTGYAGGVSAMRRDDFLYPHIDNSGHPTLVAYRRLNALFYVTPGWRQEDGGNLELWSMSLRDCREIHARFNRLVVMSTSRSSLHSAGKVLRDDCMRLCVSNYYYNSESPSGREYSHITSFRAPPGEHLKDFYLRLEGWLGTLYVRMFPRNPNKS